MKRMEKINERCFKLRELGFEILHLDSNVIHPNVPGVEFDFSATPESNFLGSALETAFKSGLKVGANSVRQQFSDLMKIEE